MKSNKHFQGIYLQTARQTGRSVSEAFKFFKEFNAAYRQGKLTKQPKPPKDRKGD